jgi:hypothetical protein
MTFSTSSFFAGVGTVLVAVGVGFGGGLLLSGSMFGSAPREPNKLERRAAEQAQPEVRITSTPVVVPKAPEQQTPGSVPGPAAPEVAAEKATSPTQESESPPQAQSPPQEPSPQIAAPAPRREPAAREVVKDVATNERTHVEAEDKVRSEAQASDARASKEAARKTKKVDRRKAAERRQQRQEERQRNEERRLAEEERLREDKRSVEEERTVVVTERPARSVRVLDDDDENVGRREVREIEVGRRENREIEEPPVERRGGLGFFGLNFGSR